MKIPIENIYFLLCYAWNKLDEKEKVKISIDESTSLLDLFAKILINATIILLKRGLNKNYVEKQLEVSGIKGKLNLDATIKRNLLFKQKTVCTYDEFSSNIIFNQILYTTIFILIKTHSLDKNLQLQLMALIRKLPNIDLIELKAKHFKRLRFNRNNQFYAFVLNVCQIIFESTLPTEKQGQYTFKDFTRDERKMNQLFEAFIRNFYKLEQNTYTTVKSESIHWKFKSENEDDITYLPQMLTDISLSNKTNKIVIDAKYYKQTMNLHYGTEKIKSANLYQLFSYLINQETHEEKTKTATGILLYPTTNKEHNLTYKYSSHKVEIKTVNLNTDWRSITKRLKNIIGIDVNS